MRLLAIDGTFIRLPDGAECFREFIPAGRFDDGGRYDAVIIDGRETSRREFLNMAAGVFSIALDEEGESRDFASVVIDTFPHIGKGRKADVSNEGLIASGRQKPCKMPDRLRRVLLSFGGEDPAGLTGITLDALSGIVDIDIIVGPLFKRVDYAKRKTFRWPRDIRPLMRRYDAVFTSYGLTAYEACREGVLPVLVNPTGRHEELSRVSGFTSLGVERLDEFRLREVVNRPPAVPVKPEGDLAGLLKNILDKGRV